ncbi:SNF2 helicase associated domain-containing protein [Caloramator quimbayensis]|uniref:SNF2 helicase associated domain-containing protein n=1 Tax=Caloramator quimbayensis TaxID=1147123 RepID=UPI001FA851B3|nr:SNF2 helicase associated domain-containing protein [Caloramator quimbayensis]
MYILTKDLVQKYCYSQSYSKGMSYYKRDMVLNLDVEEEGDIKSEYFLSLYADVEGSDGELYDVEVNFSSEHGFTFFSCTCPAFENFCEGKRFCKHIAAVLIKYLNDYKNKTNSKSSSSPNTSINKTNSLSKTSNKKEIIKPFASELSNKLYDSFVSLNSKDLRQEIILEPTININSRFYMTPSIELKTGVDRLYIVKNMASFLDAVFLSQKPLEFGKLFTFDPSIHKYSDKDMELLNTLYEIYTIEKTIGNYYSFNKIVSGKTVTITPEILKKILKIYEGSNIFLSINQAETFLCAVKPEDMPLSFSLSQSKNNISLQIDKPLPFPLTKDGEYFFYDNTIYKPSEKQSIVYSPIHNSLVVNNGKLMFPLDDKKVIISNILPTLKQISNEIKIDDKIKKDIKECTLLAKAYLDKYDEGISAKIDFIYTTNKNDIVTRDIEKEAKILSFFENCEFKYSKGIFYLSEEEKIIDFIENKLQNLLEMAEVYYSDSFKNVKIYSKSNIKSKVRLNDDDLLEFTFSIDGVDKSELKNIFESLKLKKKYHKLKNGGYLSLETQEVNEFANMIDYLNIKDSELLKDKITLSKYNALYIDQVIKSSNLSFIEKDKNFRQLISNIREIQESDFEVPKHLENVLRGYQRTGFKWFKTLSMYGFGGILADEMGLGKTLQTIAFLESEKLEGSLSHPAIVVAPTSLLYNWKAEIERFAPSLKAAVITGSKDKRLEFKENINDFDIVITSYPLLRRDIDEYKEIEFSCCILDEAQQIKNPSSLNAKCVKEINAKKRFALTGTPIENSLTELWSIFDFLMPGYLLSHRNFSLKYDNPISKNKDDRALLELNRHVKPFILRRLKKDVVKELPPKIEQTVLVEMTDKQKKLYLAYLNAAKDEIDKDIEAYGFNKSKLKMIAALTRLRQICCDPSSFIENYDGESGKISALLELLDESISGGHRILLFSQFTSVLKNIAKSLSDNGIKYMYLDGSVKSENRIDMVNRFNNGEGEVFLISLKAGGTGLNLSSADIVIHFDPWWNPAVEDQATDRAHRIGQSKTVEVIKLVAMGTVEEKILRLQELKREIAVSVVGDSSDDSAFISTLSKEELLELFKS